METAMGCVDAATRERVAAMAFLPSCSRSSMRLTLLQRHHLLRTGLQKLLAALKPVLEVIEKGCQQLIQECASFLIG